MIAVRDRFFREALLSVVPLLRQQTLTRLSVKLTDALLSFKHWISSA